MSTPRSRANSISARAVKTPSASPPARRFRHAHASPERLAEGEIARLRRETGQHQIAEPRKPHQRRPPRPERLAETAQLGETARDQGGDRACSQAVTGRDAAGDREHVLGRAADLDAANVGRMIEAQVRSAQRVAEGAREALIDRGQRHCGRQAGGDVGGEGGPGENGRLSPGRRLAQDLGHEGMRDPLDALGAGHERRGSRGPRRAASPFRGSIEPASPPESRRTARDRSDPTSLRPRATKRRQEADRCAGSPQGSRMRDSSRPHRTTARPAAAAALASAMPQAPAPATPIRFAPFMPCRAAFLCSRNSGDASNRAGGPRPRDAARRTCS